VPQQCLHLADVVTGLENVGDKAVAAAALGILRSAFGLGAASGEGATGTGGRGGAGVSPAGFTTGLGTGTAFALVRLDPTMKSPAAPAARLSEVQSTHGGNALLSKDIMVVELYFGSAKDAS